MGSLRALETYMEIIDKYLKGDGVNEVLINKPKEIWVENRGEFVKEEEPELDSQHLLSLVNLIAQSTSQIISEEKPILSTTLPHNGYRVQCVIPPACDRGNIGIAIRKKSVIHWDLDDYERMGAFTNTALEETENTLYAELDLLLKKNKIKDFIRAAARGKLNIIVSGGTSTGKTTFTNAILREIPSDERIITIEDAREIVLNRHENVLHLLAYRGGQGVAQVTTQDQIENSLRLRPDRIICGEIRGADAFSFLRAVNTGHPGSICTVHADTPRGAIEQVVLMVMQAGLGMTREQIREYILGVVHIIIQLKRASRGVRYVSEVFFNNEHEKPKSKSSSSSKKKGDSSKNKDSLNKKNI